MVADPNNVLCVPPDINPEEIMAYIETGIVPERCRAVPYAEWTAEGRLADCDCGLVQCVCAIARQHVVGCFYRLSVTCAVGVPCDEHRDETCMACYPCTCRQCDLESAAPEPLEKPSLWARLKGWVRGSRESSRSPGRDER